MFKYEIRYCCNTSTRPAHHTLRSENPDPRPHWLIECKIQQYLNNAEVEMRGRVLRGIHPPGHMPYHIERPCPASYFDRAPVILYTMYHNLLYGRYVGYGTLSVFFSIAHSVACDACKRDSSLPQLQSSCTPLHVAVYLVLSCRAPLRLLFVVCCSCRC